jgi:hypothetical protein
VRNSINLVMAAPCAYITVMKSMSLCAAAFFLLLPVMAMAEGATSPDVPPLRTIENTAPKVEPRKSFVPGHESAYGHPTRMARRCRRLRPARVPGATARVAMMRKAHGVPVARYSSGEAAFNRVRIELFVVGAAHRQRVAAG